MLRNTRQRRTTAQKENARHCSRGTDSRKAHPAHAREKHPSARSRQLPTAGALDCNGRPLMRLVLTARIFRRGSSSQLLHPLRQLLRHLVGGFGQCTRAASGIGTACGALHDENALAQQCFTGLRGL